jgi:putative transposase
MNEKTWKDQQTPALAIVARGDQIIAVDKDTYTVKSQSDQGKTYQVTKQRNGLVCTCDHFKQTHSCIHTIAVQFKTDLQDSTSKLLSIKPSCDKCGSDNVVKNGKRKNQSGTINRYLCHECGRRFTANDGFKKKRSEPEKIALALDLYFRGLSFRKISEHFQQVHNLDVSHMTVCRWVVGYGRLASEWMDSQPIHTGKRWHIDETVVKVNGGARYLWNVLDGETRYQLAIHISQNRSLPNTRAPMKKAKKTTTDRPEQVFTDGMMAYPEAVKKEFGKRGTKGSNGYWSPHHRVKSIRAEESNNIIERFHGSEKERIKVMRGFDKDGGCSSLMEGFRVHYNLVREHQGLGATPGEIAGLPKIDGFRWLEVLKKASKKPSPDKLQLKKSQ